MTSRDMRDVGLVSMSQGRFQGHQLLSRESMEASTSRHPAIANTVVSGGLRDSGLAVTLFKPFQGWGARGQFIFMMPELELLVVVTSSHDNKIRRSSFNLVPEVVLPVFIQ